MYYCLVCALKTEKGEKNLMRIRVSTSILAVAMLAVVLTACGSPTPTRTPAPLAATSAATTAPTTAATVAATEAATTAATAAATTVATEAATVVATEAATTAPTLEVAMVTEAPTVAATVAATVAVTEVATEVATATEAATEAPAAATQEALGEKPSTLPECKTSGTLSVGTDASYPPFESVEASGKIVGFDIDLLDAIAAKAGLTVDYHNAMFDTIFTALSYAQYDLVISASTITEERQKTVNFSNPYFVAGQVIVLRKADIGTVKSPADLAGKTIGVQLGTTGAEAAKEIKDTKEVKEYNTAPEAFQALSNGTVDAVVNDNVTSLSIILNSPDLNLAVVGQPFTSEYYGIAVRKECTDLLKKVNDGLAAVIADGTYATIYAKYLGEEPGEEFRKDGKGIVPTEAAATAVATTAATEAPAATAAATEAATAVMTEAATAVATP
jgi:polar amino acid transport system substrate-binding protein